MSCTKKVEVQKAAIETVKEYLERRLGKMVEDVSRKGPGDLVYDNIRVEVKGRRKKYEQEKPPYITLASPDLTEWSEKNPERFEVWFVRNVVKDRTKHQIIKVKGTQLMKWGEEAKTKRYCAKITLGEEFWTGKPERFVWVQGKPSTT